MTRPGMFFHSSPSLSLSPPPSLVPPIMPHLSDGCQVLGTRDFHEPSWFPYGKYCGQDLLIVVVTMTYGCIAPIIIIPGLIFFGMAFVVYKHQLLYSYIPIFDAGGLFWPKIYHRWIFALLLSQATLTGMFILKYAYRQVYCELALMLLTFIYAMRMDATYNTSRATTSLVPLELATSLDASMSHARREATLAQAEEYVQPPLRAPANESPEDPYYSDPLFQYRRMVREEATEKAPSQRASPSVGKVGRMGAAAGPRKYHAHGKGKLAWGP